MIYTDGVHLITDNDDLSELHAFAKKIGLKREWFQPKSHPHYDLFGSKVERAQRSGAVYVSMMQIGRIISASRNCCLNKHEEII